MTCLAINEADDAVKKIKNTSMVFKFQDFKKNLFFPLL